MVKRVDIIELLEKAAQHLRDYENKLLNGYYSDDQIAPIERLIDALDQMTLDLGDARVPNVL